MELEPLFAQVGECRQMFSERFGKDFKLYTSSVSQDIHSTHSHLDRSSLLAPTERNEDHAHTHQFCDYHCGQNNYSFDALQAYCFGINIKL